MRHRTFYVIFLAFLALWGCGSKIEEDPYDFWHQTADVLAQQNDKTLHSNGWDIGLSHSADNEDLSDLTIRKEENQTQTLMSFNRVLGEPCIIYRYTVEEEADLGRIRQRVMELTSTDDHFFNYTMRYTETLFENGNFVSQDTASGSLYIQNDEAQADEMPLLRETMIHLDQMMDDLYMDFGLSLKDTHFVDVPTIGVLADFKQVDSIADDVSDTIDYCSRPDINAKGFSLVTELRIKKSDTSQAQFGVYNVERGSYESSSQVTLESTNTENVYHILFPYDADTDYLLYITDKEAYLYDRTVYSPAQVLQDVQENGQGAGIYLSTDYSVQNGSVD